MTPTLEALTSSSIGNKLLDFGPPLKYTELCSAYTVEKMSLWQYLDENSLEVIPVKASRLPSARLEGKLYSLNDKELFLLDKRRGVGVHSERKFVHVYVPIRDQWGNMHQIYAWAYIGLKDYWVPKIEYDQNFGCVSDRHSRYLNPVRQYPHPDPLLNRRASFSPDHSNGHIGHVSDEMRNYVGIKNRMEIVRIKKSQSWTSFRRKVYSFVNDE